MYFLYQGKGSSYAQLMVYAEESLFSNITALVENELTYINNQNYKVLQPTQCGNYTIKNISACDVLVTYQGLPTEGEPIIKDLVVGAIDEQGYEYIINYHGTEKLYDHFFPVAKEMIRSYNITQSGSFPGEDNSETAKVEARASQYTNSSSVDELISNGESLYDLGKYEEAITYFDKVLALDANDTYTLYYKGISLESLGKHEEAITYFDKVLALNPTDTDTLTYKGISLESLGKHEEAITYFDRVLSLDPNNANTLSWKQYSLDNLGKYENTLTNFTLQETSTSLNSKELNDAKDKMKGMMKYILNSIFPQAEGKFSNTDYGVEMMFPKNWTGFEMKFFLPMAVVSPQGFNITSIYSPFIESFVDNMVETIGVNNVTKLTDQQFQELIEPKIQESLDSLSKSLMEYLDNKTSLMSITIYDKELMRLTTSTDPNFTTSIDSLTSLYEHFVASDPTFSCDRRTLNQTVLNNMPVEFSTEACMNTTSNIYANNLNYFVLTQKAIVGIQYSSDSENINDKYIQEFIESLKSLSINESLPINNQSIDHFLNDNVQNNTDTLLNNTAPNILNTFNENELLSQGRYEQAISLYNSRLDVDAKDLEALQNK
jgi:tetratricopeptide (TPR) repeat protein